MKLKVFTVHDSKAGAYLQPFFMPSKGSAIRAWSDAINDPQSQFYKHAADYTLFELGEFDNETGFISMNPQHGNLGNGIDFKNNELMGQILNTKGDSNEPK